jgi:hypothetical protein
LIPVVSYPFIHKALAQLDEIERFTCWRGSLAANPLEAFGQWGKVIHGPAACFLAKISAVMLPASFDDRIGAAVWFLVIQSARKPRQPCETHSASASFNVNPAFVASRRIPSSAVSLTGAFNLLR